MTDAVRDPATGAAGGTVPGRPRVDMTVETVHEQYVPGRSGAPGGGHEVQVMVRIRVRGLEATALRHPPERSEVIVIDCSGSMGHPSVQKIAAARRAAAAAIEMLPDGTHFALVAGTDTARVVHPRCDPASPATVAASPASRADGARAALTLEAHGGTRISSWLSLVHTLLTARPGTAFRHALLLTDGVDQHGRAGELRRVLDDCAGEFECDALGIGEGWDAEQLREIADRLRGRVEAVVDDPPDTDGPRGTGGGEGLGEQLTRLFRELVGASTRRRLSRLTVAVHTGPQASVVLFRQVNPAVLDLTGTAVRDGDRTLLPTGAWGEETRWYELRLRVDPGHPSVRETGEARIASLGLDADAAAGVVLPSEERITVRWVGQAPPTDLGVAGRHFRRYTELEEATRAGCAALGRHDVPSAERELGRAVRLAYELGDASHLARLRALVTVENAAVGLVRVRDAVDPGHLRTLIARSSRTAPPPGAGGGEPPPPGAPGDGAPGEAGAGHSEKPPVRCPRCAAWVRPERFCESCGRPLGEDR
ncbi:vWA domain-containing protein [Streptomyces barkulensis]|uniref:vWA domain-containing protein n=1 Tax=Streptomyces barkulensis TaxID=1257026 RepID=UPI000C6CC672|nr:vWA domain-containing protein [Streptomyces barkulensis]